MFIKIADSSGNSTVYVVVYTFSVDRVLIRYDGGLVVIAERDLASGTWDLAADPATAEENVVIKQFMPAVDTTELTITKPS